MINIFSVILNLEDTASSAYAVTSEEEVLENVQEYEILSVDPLVRCRECKHRPVKSPDKEGRLWITAPKNYNEDCLSTFAPAVGEYDLTCPYLCDDPYYNRMPDDDYYCADGEREERCH